MVPRPLSLEFDRELRCSNLSIIYEMLKKCKDLKDDELDMLESKLLAFFGRYQGHTLADLVEVFEDLFKEAKNSTEAQQIARAILTLGVEKYYNDFIRVEL